MLENDDILLRALEPEDLDKLYIWENDTENWIHGNTLTPYSRLTLRNYISEVQSQDLFQAKQLRLMVVLKQEQTIIGTIDLYDFDPHHNRAGLGILIDKPYRQKQYACQVLQIIEEYCFAFLRLNQIYAFIANDNIKSIKLFENNNYTKSGTLKDWICCNSIYKDVFIFQRLNSDLKI